jgi:hypothetical protein
MNNCKSVNILASSTTKAADKRSCDNLETAAASVLKQQQHQQQQLLQQQQDQK